MQDTLKALEYYKRREPGSNGKKKIKRASLS